MQVTINLITLIVIIVFSTLVGFLVGFMTGKSVAKEPKDENKSCGSKANPHEYGPWSEWGTWMYGPILTRKCKRCGWACTKKTYAQ